MGQPLHHIQQRHAGLGWNRSTCFFYDVRFPFVHHDVEHSAHAGLHYETVLLMIPGAALAQEAKGWVEGSVLNKSGKVDRQ